MNSQDIIKQIRDGKYDTALDELYRNYPAFLNSLLKSGGSQEDAEDIFQNALLILLEKLESSAFELNCSIHTYLFSVCRNLSLVYFKKLGKKISLLDEEKNHYSEEEASDFMIKEQKYQALDIILQKVGEQCLEILKLFYVKRMNMKAIAERLGFKSDTSAKTQKYKCLEKARKLSETVLTQLETR